MVVNPLKEDVTVLTSDAEWGWPMALETIFRPRGVNLLVAKRPVDFVNIIEKKRVHTAIIDMDYQQYNGFATVRMIRAEYPTVPCIMLTQWAEKELLRKALELEVFGVLDKPVDMLLLQGVLDRLFTKKYNIRIFSD